MVYTKKFAHNLFIKFVATQFQLSFPFYHANEVCVYYYIDKKGIKTKKSIIYTFQQWNILKTHTISKKIKFLFYFSLLLSGKVIIKAEVPAVLRFIFSSSLLVFAIFEIQNPYNNNNKLYYWSKSICLISFI